MIEKLVPTHKVDRVEEKEYGVNRTTLKDSLMDLGNGLSHEINTIKTVNCEIFL